MTASTAVITSNETVKRTHPKMFIFIAATLLTSALTAGYMTMFVSGSLETSIFLNYYTVIILNFLAIPLWYFDVLTIGEWWVWYIASIHWIGGITFYSTVVRQFTGNLTREGLRETTDNIIEAVLIFILSLAATGIIGKLVGMDLQQIV
jgi:hypothetical protein